MKKTFIVEEVVKVKHKITVEVDDTIGIAEEIYNADELVFDKVESVIQVSNNLENCEVFIYSIDGVECVEIEEGTWETEKFEYIGEE